jgi:hypothetical protein
MRIIGHTGRTSQGYWYLTHCFDGSLRETAENAKNIWETIEFICTLACARTQTYTHRNGEFRVNCVNCSGIYWYLWKMIYQMHAIYYLHYFSNCVLYTLRILHLMCFHMEMKPMRMKLDRTLSYIIVGYYQQQIFFGEFYIFLPPWRPQNCRCQVRQGGAVSCETFWP